MSAPSTTRRTDLYSLTLPQVEELAVNLGHKAYRGRQLWHLLYRRKSASIAEMTELPQDLRLALGETAILAPLDPVKEATSAHGDATKALSRLGDGVLVESVLMRYPSGDSVSRHTVCVSTQAGCAVGCPFCATGAMGFIRNLTVGEIVAQVLHFARREPIENIVFMGMGEPFLNYDRTWQAIETMNSPLGLGLGARRITVSTSGIVPGIRRLAREKLLVNLAVSLHASNDALRARLVPINKKYPIAALMEACDEYVERTGRRVSYEYVLLAGVNDSEDLAQELGDLLQGRLAHVNLIPVNPTPGPFHRPSHSGTHRFQDILHHHGIRTTIRAEKGVEISAACGQLATAS